MLTLDGHRVQTIFNSKCLKQGIKVMYEVSKKAIRVLSMQRGQANFGNAGAVDNLLKAAVAKASLHPGTDGIVLQPDDIDGVSIDDSVDPLKLLDGLYKVDAIRAELVAIRNVIQVAQGEGSPLPPIGHFVFRVHQHTLRNRASLLCLIRVRVGESWHRKDHRGSCHVEDPVPAGHPSNGSYKGEQRPGPDWSAIVLRARNTCGRYQRVITVQANTLVTRKRQSSSSSGKQGAACSLLMRSVSIIRHLEAWLIQSVGL